MLLSLDCESASLQGRTFIVSAIVADEEGREKERFVARWPMPEEEMNEWTRENVLPKCTDIPITHPSFEALLKDFVEFWKKWEKPTIVAHIPFPVETNFLNECYRHGFIKEMEGFYGIFTLETSLASMGCKFDSVDDFVKKEGLVKAEGENTHNPTYDALVALMAHQEIGKRLREAMEIFNHTREAREGKEPREGFEKRL